MKADAAPPAAGVGFPVYPLLGTQPTGITMLRSHIFSRLLAAGVCAMAGMVHAAEHAAAKPASAKLIAKTADIYRIESMEVGDRACYVRLTDARGKSQEDLADFEIREQTPLVGQRVRIRRKKTPVMSAACEGREDCSLTDTVNLITSVRKVGERP